MEKITLLAALIVLHFLTKASTIVFGSGLVPVGNSITLKFESASQIAACAINEGININSATDWATLLGNPGITSVIVNEDEITFILSNTTEQFYIEPANYSAPGSSCNVIDAFINKNITNFGVQNQRTWATTNLQDIDTKNLLFLKELNLGKTDLQNVEISSTAPIETLGLGTVTGSFNFDDIISLSNTLKTLLLEVSNNSTISLSMPLLELFVFPYTASNKTVDLSSCPNLNAVFIDNSLIDGTPKANNIISLNISNTALSLSMLNDICVALDDNGLSSGYLNYIGLPAPTGAGLTAKNNLISKGWTIIE